MRKIIIFSTIFVLVVLLIAGITSLSSASLNRSVDGAVSGDESAMLGLKLHSMRTIAGNDKHLAIFTFTNNKSEKLIKIDVECLSACEAIQKVKSATTLRTGDVQTVDVYLVSHPTPGTYHPIFGITARWSGSYLVTQRQVELVIIAPTPTPKPPLGRPGD